MTYAWKQLSGTTVTLTGADTATPSVTTPSSTAPMTFELTVSGVSCVPFCYPGAPALKVTSTDTVEIVVPAVTLTLSPVQILEADDADTPDVAEHTATVTATLSHESTVATTVTVSAAAVTPAVAGDFSLSTNKTLTIAPGDTSSTGTVTISAVNNTVDAANKPVTVSGRRGQHRGGDAARRRDPDHRRR